MYRDPTPSGTRRTDPAPPTIEAGVDLTAAEHVYIGKGVIGNSTKVKSKGNVECGFVQQAAISAVGDVRVAQHVIGAHIRAGGVIRVEGKSHDGRGVIGGDLVAVTRST